MAGNGLAPAMSDDLACELCTMTEILEFEDKFECVTCGHEWAKEIDDSLVVKDAHGNLLADGDIVAMIKDLKMKGTSHTLKSGTKSKPIRLVDGDHDISCKMDNMAIMLKSQYVKKVGP